MRQILSQRTPATYPFGLLVKVTKTLSRGVQAKSENQWPTATGRLPMRVLLQLMTAPVLCVVFSTSQSAVAQSTFTNLTSIADGFSTELSAASPYPSEIAVLGLPGLVTKVTVTLNNLNFGSPPDADILLVAPNGQSVILMSDAAGDGTGHIINKTLTFDDAALSPLPSDGTLRSGTYKPTNFDVGPDFFPPPAPAGPYVTTLPIFNGTNPNGTWNLYMVDDLPDNPFDDFGPDVVISGGWSLTVTASTQSPPVNPIDEAQFFVRQHYLDFFNRHADDLGLAFWTNEITPCGFDQQCIEIKRINVSAAFFLSIEFQETGYLVYRMYKAAYGDMPGTPVPLTRQEFLPDNRRVGQGVVVGASAWELTLENNKNLFASELVARARFTTAFPQGMTSEQFVDALNANAGGTLSQGERNQLVSELASGAKTRAQVLRSVAEDADFAQAEFNKAFVLMQYFGYLRRNPNDAPDLNFVGYDFWLDKLNQFNGNFV